LTLGVIRAIICLFFLLKWERRRKMVRVVYGNEAYLSSWDGRSEASFRSYRAHEVRVRVVEHGVKRLCAGDLPGREHTERYLRHKYRLNLSAGTIRGNISVLHSFLTFLKDIGKRSLEEIRRTDLEAFIEQDQDRGVNPSTVNTHMKGVKAFVRFLMGEGVVPSEVLLRRLTIKVPDGLPRAIEPEDVRRLLGVIEDVRGRAMVLLLLRTGMRIGELLATRVDDVVLDERKILIVEAEKNRVGRVVYLSDDAMDALGGWLRIRDTSKRFLFYARGRHTMSYTTARSMFYRYLIKAGLAHKGYSLHCLRHTFATELLNAGMRLECLQVLLGHHSLQMTRRYARLSDKTRQEEYFRAMTIIEREHHHGNHQLDCDLQTLFEEEELRHPHGEELSEHP
jgi:site-specific recombinase XerD